MSYLNPLTLVASDIPDLKVAATAPPVLASASDGELVIHMRAGRARAEEFLFKRHARLVFRVARRSLRDASEAEDIVQDTFTAAHESIATLRDPAAYRGWLLQIAMRLVQRRFRRSRMLAALGFVAMPEGPELTGLAHEGITADQRAELARVDAALRTIEPGERLAWFLRHVEGLTLPEVALACDCSLATAKRRLVRAQARVVQVTGAELDDA